jgi:hypothetical protein
MAEAPREQAMATMAGILATMTGTRFWGGEYPNPITIERRFIVPAQRAEFPRLCVLEGSGARRVFGETGGVGRYVDQFVVMLYGYVIGTDAVPRAMALTRLEYDCFVTLAQAPMPNGYIRNFDFSRPAETDQGADEPIGVFAWPIGLVLDDEVLAA